MTNLQKIRGQLARLRRDERGSVAVETIFMVPLLVWALLATTSYFHAYRSEALADRAASTLADMVSRETEFITPSYLNGMRGMLQFLTLAPTTPDFRLTAFTWDEDDSRYEVRWSRQRGSQITYNTTRLQDVAHKLPILLDDEVAILVETWTPYSPKFTYSLYDLGLRDFDFRNFIVVQPRFATQVCFNGDANLDPSKARC